MVWADWVIDATETGDLLPLCGAEYVTGFESREETGEPHAPPSSRARRRGSRMRRRRRSR
jgi:hypothetical protein